MKAVSTGEFYSWILAIITLLLAHQTVGGENGSLSGYVVLAATLALLLLAAYKLIQAAQAHSPEPDSPLE